MNLTAVKNILGRKMAGANIDDILGVSDFSIFKEAAANMVNEIDLAETVRHTQIEIFQDVYDYNPPDDIKSLVDIRPQSGRDVTDNPTHRFTEEFDQQKSNKNDDFTLEWVDATKILRYAKPVGNNAGVHDMDGLATNGTWDGTASNIALDTFNPFKGSGSIIADYNTGEYIENDNMTEVDLSDHKNKSNMMIYGYFPDASLVTNINLRWGNSDTVYFDRTVTAPQIGSFKNGWNLIPFAWNGASETGTVDATAIDYIRITPTLSSSDTDIKFDNVFSALGEIRDFVYYSKYLFRDTSGTWLETPTDDTDIINLDTDAENLYVYECIRLAALGLQGQESIYNTYTDLLYGTPQQVGAYSRYKTRNPEEPIKPQSRHRRFGYNKK